MEALEKYDFDELQDVLFEMPEKEQKERFKVDSLQSADWCLRKIRSGDKKKKEIREFAEAEIERITAWMDKEIARIEEGQAFFESLLAEYLYEQRKIDPKFRISTPNGTVSTRKQQPKWEYDDAKLLEFLKQNGKREFIRVKEEVNKAELKKNLKVINGQAITEDGEIIEGITVTEQGEKVVVRVVD